MTMMKKSIIIILFSFCQTNSTGSANQLEMSKPFIMKSVNFMQIVCLHIRNAREKYRKLETIKELKSTPRLAEKALVPNS